ncbi:hypothetical protein [Nocardioides salarius]|uniref:hypothetical protein n=1 Tax=Nocardioides salarius TaxID=374513 RepID=UPI0030FA6222
MIQPLAEALQPGTAGCDDCRGHRLVAADLGRSDSVLAAEGSRSRVVTLTHAIEAADAIGRGIRDRELLTRVQQGHAPPTADLDVAAPYRRGDEVARTVADHIDRLLRPAVTALSCAGEVT